MIHVHRHHVPLVTIVAGQPRRPDALLVVVFKVGPIHAFVHGVVVDRDRVDDRLEGQLLVGEVGCVEGDLDDRLPGGDQEQGGVLLGAGGGVEEAVAGGAGAGVARRVGGWGGRVRRGETNPNMIL